MKNNQYSHFRYLLLFTLSITLFLFASCSKTETDMASPPSDTEPADTILSDLFSETVCELQENVWLSNDIIPYYDTEAQTITTLLTEIEETVGEDDVITETRTGCLYTFDHNGRVLDKTYIPLKEGAYIRDGMVFEHTVIYTTVITTKNQQEFTLHRTDRETLETVSVDFDPSFGWESEYDIHCIAVDSEERVYCTDRETVLVLNPDLTTAFTYDFPTTIYTMARGADGNVWVTFSAGMESCAATIDPDTKMLGTYHTFTRGMDQINKPLHYLLGAAIPSGDSDYSFFYYDMSSEVWGVTVEEDGSITETRVIDLFNSGISQLWTESYVSSSGLVPIAFLTDDLFMTRRYAEDGTLGSIFVLLNRADNIDMSEQTVITIAYAYPLAASAVEHIQEFKRTRPDLSFVLEDYSTYATLENPSAGEEKLCFDIVNGFVKPDIVITDASVNTLSDNAVMTQLYRNNLYVDLVPYLEQDDTLNFDNLFSCIRRLFDDGKGGMWGITTDFTANILSGSTKLLGNLTEKGYWSLSELLDFFNSLPEDTEKLYGYNGKQSKWLLLAQGYGYFIDDGSCSFNSEEFIRYLSFLQTVPATYQEWQLTSPVAEIRNLPYADQDAAFNSAMAEGKIALNIDSISYRYIHRMLFSDTTFPIGFATKNDSGFRIKANTTYVITAFAENPDLCFDLVKSFFAYEVKYVDTYSFTWPLFARKDHFENALLDETTVEDWMLMTEEEWKAYCKERGTPYSKRAEAPVPLTDEERMVVYELFDRMGSPIIEETPEAVADIVNEEISVFLSGMGNAEDCAKKIQSRVEIWLAEHE